MGAVAEARELVGQAALSAAENRPFLALAKLIQAVDKLVEIEEGR